MTTTLTTDRATYTLDAWRGSERTLRCCFVRSSEGAPVGLVYDHAGTRFTARQGVQLEGEFPDVDSALTAVAEHYERQQV